jgi:hypothetical protein
VCLKSRGEAENRTPAIKNQKSHMKKNLPPFKSGAACEYQPSIKIKIKVAAPYVKTKTWITLWVKKPRLTPLRKPERNT